MKTFGRFLLFMLALSAAGRLGRADYHEETCRNALSSVKKYNKTWGERIAREQDPIYCALVNMDAQRAPPEIPAECGPLQFHQVSDGFQAELAGIITDKSKVSPQASIGGLISQALHEMLSRFDAQCTKSATKGRSL